ncbi:MAG: S-layer homology domain-containing protein, partial [Clostridia bacterium]
MSKMKKLTSLLVSAAIFLSAFPSLAAEKIDRQYVIDQFVTAVGEENLPAQSVDISSFADSGDVSPEYINSMGLAVANGLINGYEDNTLRPQNSITRLEALLILSRCLPDIPEKRGSTDFSDVPAWAEDEIDRLYRGEIVNGYGNGLLGADDEISSEQVALLTERVTSGFSRAPRLRDDFYTAVNYDFISAGEIPEGQLMLSRMTILDNIVDENMVNISEELLSRKAELESAAPSMELQAAKFYELACEADRSSSTDVSPLKKYFDMIDSCEKLSKLGFTNGSILRDLQVPLLFDVVIPYRITGEKGYHTLGGVYIDYVGTGIERSYWEDGGKGYDCYKEYAETILTLLNVEDSARKAKEIADIQKEIA